MDVFLVFGGASAFVILVLVAIGAWQRRGASGSGHYPNGFRADRPALGRLSLRKNGRHNG